MKKAKRFVALLLMLAMTLSLFGCGEEKSPQNIKVGDTVTVGDLEIAFEYFEFGRKLGNYLDNDFWRAGTPTYGYGDGVSYVAKPGQTLWAAGFNIKNTKKSKNKVPEFQFSFDFGNEKNIEANANNLHGRKANVKFFKSEVEDLKGIDDSEEVRTYGSVDERLANEMGTPLRFNITIGKKSFFCDVRTENTIVDLVEVKRDGKTMNKYSNYVFDDAGRVIEKKENNTTHKYDYNEIGLVVADHEDNCTTYYTYNEQGQVQHESVQYVPEMADRNKEIEYGYQYDEFGRVVEKTYFNQTDGAWTQVFTYTYDENGLVVSETETNYHDGLGTPANSSYNKKNTYDSNGRKVSSYSMNNETGERVNYKYIYDVVG